MISDSELEQKLRRMECSTSPILDERIMKDAFAVFPDSPKSSGPNVEWQYGGQKQWRTFLWAAVCLFVLVGVVVWTLQPSDSWAQVTEAVRAQTWIHGTADGPDGQKNEFWFSPKRDVSARRQGLWARFDDHRLRVRYTYEPQEKRLYRVPHTSFQKEDFRSFEGVFQKMFRGDETLNSPLPGTDVVEQQQRRIEENGRKWIEYDLLLRRQAGSPEGKNLGRLVFRVDPNTKLPQMMKLIDLSGETPKSIEFTFDYPQRGPIDIYALGVPRSTELVDRVPTDDLSRLVEGIKASRERFGDYQAYILDGEVIESQTRPGKFHTLPSLYRVFRKGNRWRWEAGQFRLDAKWPELPAPDADMRSWVKDYADRLQFFPLSICDGKAIYNAHLTQPKGRKLQEVDHWELKRRLRPGRGFYEVGFDQARWFLPECYVYAPHLPFYYQDFEVEVVSKPKDGPADTILVIARDSSDANSNYIARYWIDPSRSFAVLRWEYERLNEKPQPYIMEKLDKTPGGIWYPTRTRWKTELRDQVKQFFLDFEAELPDSLFQIDGKVTDD